MMRRTLMVVAAVAAVSIPVPHVMAQRGCTGECPERSEEMRRELARAQAELARLTAMLSRGDSLDPAVLARVRLELVEAMESIERLQMTRVQEREARGVVERRVFIREAPRAGREGWIGISFSSNFAVHEDRGGRAFRFEGYPVIEAVEPGSPARRAGIEVGDVLLRMGDRDLTRDAIEPAVLLRPGSRLPLQIRRDGKTRTVTVVVAERPHEIALVPTPPDAPLPPAPPRVRVRVGAPESAPRAAAAPAPPAPPVVIMSTSMVALAGAEMATMPGEMHEQVGIDGGMLVLRVGLNTPAARAGLREGDVIVAADGRRVRSSVDLRLAFRRAMEARRLTLDLKRKGKDVTAELAW